MMICLMVQVLLIYHQSTVSKAKHEILFSRFGINYNDLAERYKKGSVLVREPVLLDAGAAQPQEGKKKSKLPMVVTLYHCDIIGDAFWAARPSLLE